MQVLRVDWDSLFELSDLGGYPESSYDIGKSAHSVTILQENRDAFVEEMGKWFANIVRKNIEEYTCEVDTDYE